MKCPLRHHTRPAGALLLRVPALVFEAALVISFLNVLLEHLRMALRLVTQALCELAAELAKWVDLFPGASV